MPRADLDQYRLRGHADFVYFWTSEMKTATGGRIDEVGRTTRQRSDARLVLYVGKGR